MHGYRISKIKILQWRILLYFSGCFFVNDLIYSNRYRRNTMNLCQLTKFSICIMVKRIFLFFSGCFCSSADFCFYMIWFIEMSIGKLEWIYVSWRNSVYVLWSRGCFYSLADFSVLWKRFFSWVEWCLYIYIYRYIYLYIITWSANEWVSSNFLFVF
jgi:hypothetical protein